MSPPNEIAPKIDTSSGQAALDDIRNRKKTNGDAENISADIYGAMVQRYKQDPNGARAFNDQLYNAAKTDPEMRRYLPEINLVDGRLIKDGFQDASSEASRLAAKDGKDPVTVDNLGTIHDGGTTTAIAPDAQSAITKDDHHGIDITTNGHKHHLDDADMAPLDGGGYRITQPEVPGKHPQTLTEIRPDGSYDTTIGKKDDPKITIHGNPDGTSRTSGKNFVMDANAEGTTTAVAIGNADGSLSQLTPKEAATAKLGPDGRSLTYDRIDKGAGDKPQTTHVQIGADGKETLTFAKADGTPGGTDPSGATEVHRDKPGGKITEKDYPKDVKVQLDDQGNVTKWTQGDGHGGVAKEFTVHRDGSAIAFEESTPGHTGQTLRLDREPQIGNDGQMHFTVSGMVSASKRTDGTNPMANDESGADQRFSNWNK